MCKLVSSDSVIGNYVIESIEKDHFVIQKDDLLNFDKVLSKELRKMDYYTDVDANGLINFEENYSFLFDSLEPDAFRIKETQKDTFITFLTRFFRLGMPKTVISTMKTVFQAESR